MLIDEFAPFAKLDEIRKPHQPKDAWIIDLAIEIPLIDMNTYFQTSGELIEKLKVLEQDLWQAAGKVRKFHNKMLKLKDEANYLQITHENGHLVVRRKFKRKKAIKNN